MSSSAKCNNNNYYCYHHFTLSKFFIPALLSGPSLNPERLQVSSSFQDISEYSSRVTSDNAKIFLKSYFSPGYIRIVFSIRFQNQIIRSKMSVQILMRSTENLHLHG